ncbi:hypothetical protein [Streptomyces sp. NPDC051776]|uniref:hypothetical protein n=1 Tax=Streptomyces sp. NPDC051776 TaxID=3155414 RepID=UPI003411F9FE
MNPAADDRAAVPDGRDGGSEATPFWRQRSWLLSAAFVAMIVLLAAASRVIPDEGADASAADLDGTNGPLTSGVRTADGRPQGCRTDDSSSAVPTSAPAGVVWKKIDLYAVPTSRTAGPLKTSRAVWWCFAHTPLGAVLAAHTIPVHMSGPDWRPVAREQLVPGKARNTFAAQRSSFADADGAEGQVGSYAGFSLSDYSQQAATVRMLIKFPQGGFGSTSVSVRWSGGDWKVLPRGDGSLHSSLVEAQNNGDFIMWGAQRGLPEQR